MTYEIAVLIAFAAAQIADVLTTVRFLRHGVPEGNPLIAKLMGLGKGWIAIKLAVAGGAAYYLHVHNYDTVILVLAALVAAVAVWNYRVVPQE